MQREVELQPSGTSLLANPSARRVALAVYAVALTGWVYLVGVPTDPYQVFVWFWLASIAWFIGQRDRYLDFPRDWWPTFAVLIVYLYSRGLSDNVLSMPVHYHAALDADRWLSHTFTGTSELPTQYLQARLCGSPCVPASAPHWYDVALTTVYFSHFVVGLTIALVLWIRNRAAWIAWLTRYLTMNILGLVVYIFYPAAPPWMAARDGIVDTPLPRLAARGWDTIGLGGFHVLLADVGNPVAAMPSLHGGIAMLVALWTIRHLRTRWRWLVLAYPIVMGFALVYFAEHYVIDLLAGWLLAAMVMTSVAVAERSGIWPTMAPIGSAPGKTS